MTFASFTRMRKREIFEFLRRRYGRRWRQVVTHQLDIHPRTFERWKAGDSVPRYLARVEAWARTVGFTSPTDDEVRAALTEYRGFRRSARRRFKKALSERNSPETPVKNNDLPALHAALHTTSQIPL